MRFRCFSNLWSEMEPGRLKPISTGLWARLRTKTVTWGTNNFCDIPRTRCRDSYWVCLVKKSLLFGRVWFNIWEEVRAVHHPLLSGLPKIYIILRDNISGNSNSRKKISGNLENLPKKYTYKIWPNFTHTILSHSNEQNHRTGELFGVG